MKIIKNTTALFTNAKQTIRGFRPRCQKPSKVSKIAKLTLPFPTSITRTFSSGSYETITCEGWSTPNDKLPGICREFEEKGNVPG